MDPVPDGTTPTLAPAAAPSLSPLLQQQQQHPLQPTPAPPTDPPAPPVRPGSGSIRSARSTSSRSVSGVRRKTIGSVADIAMPPFVEKPVMGWERLTSDSTEAWDGSGLYASRAPFWGSAPPPLKGHTATAIRSNLYLIGGLTPSGVCFPGVARFSTTSLRWDQLRTTGHQPPPLRGHSTVALRDALYVFGGGEGSSYSNDIYVFDTNTFRWSRLAVATPQSQRPPLRRAHSACALDSSSFIIMGGGDGGKALSDVWVFDARTLLWRELLPSGPHPLPPRGYHAACVIGRSTQLVISGGSNSTETFSGLDVLDLTTGAWSRREARMRPGDGEEEKKRLLELDRQRSYHAIVPLGNLLLLIGGDESESTAHSSIACYDIQRKRWRSLPLHGLAPGPRLNQTATIVDSRLWLYGGTQGRKISGDFHVIDLATYSAFEHIPPDRIE